MNSNEKCLCIKIDYISNLILPSNFIDSLHMFKKAKGDIYNNSLQFIESDFDIRVVDLNKIKPVDPDPKLQKEKMEAYYKKLKEELASLEAEMNRI